MGVVWILRETLLSFIGLHLELAAVCVCVCDGYMELNINLFRTSVVILKLVFMILATN